MVGPTSFGYQVAGFGGGTAVSLGSLELIDTQSVSSAVCDFTSLGDYDIHFFTFFDIEVTTQTEFGYRLSDDGGTSFETGYAFANQRGNASGTLAYSGPATRSSTDTGFVIRGGVVNKISGVAINPILSGASDTTSRKSGNIAYRAAYHSKGLLSGQIFNLYRDPTSAQPYRGGTAGGDGGLRQDDNTAKSGISGWGTSRALAADGAAVVGFGAAPKAGEFYILQNFTSYVGTDVSGAGSGSDNMMDYSQVTGG